MSDNYIEVTGADFDEKVLKSPTVVIVLFVTESSSTCQIQEPEFAAISSEYKDRMAFARVNVDGEKELATQYKIEGVPTLVFFKYGQEIYRIEGIMMRDKLRRRIEGVLLAN